MMRVPNSETSCSNPQSSMYFAVISKDEEKVKHLLKDGFDVHAKVNGPFNSILVAVGKGLSNIVELLLINGADVNSRYPIEETVYKGSTLLYRAAAKGLERVVEILLEYGADVNCKSFDRSTSLHIAAEKGFQRVVEILVQKGADVNAVTDDNYNYKEAFFENIIISQYTNFDVVDVSNLSQYEGFRSPLHVAVRNGQRDIVGYLLQWGANVDMHDCDWETALSLAVFMGDYPSFKPVLNYSPRKDDICNKKALAYAMTFKGEMYEIMIHKLLHYGFACDANLLDFQDDICVDTVEKVVL